MRRQQTLGPAVLLSLLAAVGCQSAYYSAWETLGWHKRDILVDRVQEARDDQAQAKEQFASALEEFQALVGTTGSDLETKYATLAAELERSEAAAEAVHERVAAVANVAEALFDEWEDELDDYASQDLRRASERQLRATRQRYDRLIEAMRTAEAKMEPVLVAFRDQVLFLKHNLNAQAIASLQNTTADLEEEVARLIHDMEQAIDEANAFIDAMQAPGAGE